MGKRGLMAATAFSVLVFVCPGCQSNGNPNMPQSTGTSAVAPSNYDSTVSSSKEKGSKVMTQHTPREWGCAHSRADKQCDKDAAQCFYTFTVTEIGDGQNLEVKYPPSVWSATRKEDRDSEKEQNYKKEYDKPFYLRLMAGSAAPTAGKTYSFTRCPENEFTLGDIQPDEEAGPGGPEQKSVR